VDKKTLNSDIYEERRGIQLVKAKLTFDEEDKIRTILSLNRSK